MHAACAMQHTQRQSRSISSTPSTPIHPSIKHALPPATLLVLLLCNTHVRVATGAEERTLSLNAASTSVECPSCLVRTNVVSGKSHGLYERASIHAPCAMSHASFTTREELTVLGECPIDPGGYFIVNGTERVILIQEQLSKNRIILETDKGSMIASVTSSTHERKTRTVLLTKHEKLYVKHNSFSEELPVVVVLKVQAIPSLPL
jgi:DNA-directed RNA polymerase beta subunit